MPKLPNRETLRFLGLCVAWYLSSSFTNNFGKQIMNEFRFPVTLTFVQFGLVAFFSILAEKLGGGRLLFPTMAIALHILPLAIFQVVSHILSSIAISRIPVSLLHTIKALSPLITVFSYSFGFGVSYSYKVYLSLCPLTFGVMLVCLNEIKFQMLGFLCALAATFVFVMQNIYSKKLFNQASSKHTLHSAKTPKLDKLNMLFMSSLLAFVLMSPVWIYSEGWTLLVSDIPRPSYLIVLLFFLNGVTNFLQCLIAFWVLSLVSPITYSIASLVKRIFVILLSIVYFKDTVRAAQGVGIALTFLGLYLYDDAKRDVARGDAKVAIIQERESETLPLTQNDLMKT